MANPYGKINQTINQPINSQLTKQTTIQSLTLLIQLFLTIILWVLIIVFSAQYTSVSVLKINQIKRISISAHCLPFRLDWLVKEWARVSTSEIEREKERKRERKTERKTESACVCLCLCVCVEEPRYETDLRPLQWIYHDERGEESQVKSSQVVLFHSTAFICLSILPYL